MESASSLIKLELACEKDPTKKVSISKDKAIKGSQFFASMFETEQKDEDGIIKLTLPIASPLILQKVVDFITHHLDVEPMIEIERPLRTPELKKLIPVFYAEMVESMQMEQVFELINAASYLQVQELVELGCARIGALMQKQKDVQGIRDLFGIENDFTPEEEAAIKEGKADIWGLEDDEGSSEVLKGMQNEEQKRVGTVSSNVKKA